MPFPEEVPERFPASFPSWSDVLPSTTCERCSTCCGAAPKPPSWVSTDLSHYHDYGTARAMDAATSAAIEDLRGDAPRLRERLRALCSARTPRHRPRQGTRPPTTGARPSRPIGTLRSPSADLSAPARFDAPARGGTRQCRVPLGPWGSAARPSQAGRSAAPPWGPPSLHSSRACLSSAASRGRFMVRKSTSAEPGSLRMVSHLTSQAPRRKVVERRLLETLELQLDLRRRPKIRREALPVRRDSPVSRAGSRALSPPRNGTPR